MNKIDLNGRHAIITGGAKGIGLAIVRRALESEFQQRRLKVQQFQIARPVRRLRNGLSDAMLVANRANGNRAILDSPAYVTEFSAPGDAFQLIDDLNAHFFAVPFSESVRLKLAEEVLMDGGRYYEWTLIWEAYLAEPTQVNRLIVKTYLDRLFRYLFRLAEFQLV